MVGKFLLGMMSGSLLVLGGLVVGSVVAPLPRPAAVPDGASVPLAAPDPVTADAGATAAQESAAVADPEPATDAGAAETAAEVAVTPATAGSTGAEPEAAMPTPPAIALAEPEPEVPADPGPEAPALAAPAATEMAAPETPQPPDRPAETTADAAATADLATPEPVPMPEPAAEPERPAEADPQVAAVAPEAAALPEAAPQPEAADMPEIVLERLPEPVLPPAAAATPEPASAPEAEVPTPAPEIALVPEPQPLPDPAAQTGPEAAAEDVAPGPDPATASTEAVDPGPDAVEADTGLSVAEAMPAPAAPEAGVPETEAGLPGQQPDTMPGTPVMPETAEAEARSSTFVPAPRLVRRGEGVIIGRGTEEATPEPGSDPATDPAADPTAVPEDPRPIAQFAATFENPMAKPPLAILLVDNGAPDLDRAGLAALPFPVSFALDPLDPASAEHAAIYRAADREVVMLVTGIAQGARASDVEVAFQSMEQGLPEAVAAMDLATPTFQNNRGLAATVVPILKASGRGLLTREGGLNAADQVARREDVEAAVVFRDLDTAGTDRAALRRLLDRAVFKAGQDGRATVVGTASADLAAALLEWTVEGRSATVALAPVTATLRVD